jgi:nucleoside 2-deoxyribosyltransferase
MKQHRQVSDKDTGPAKCIYCSGPLFCPEERGLMLALARRLEECGYATFLPQRDGIEALVMGMIDSPLNVNLFNIRKALDRAIFALDIYQILERCDALVFNMNGRVPDEGALVETAVAWTAGKPLVIYKDDARTAFKGMDNSMISGLVYTRRVGSLEKIPAELEKTLKKVSTAGDNPCMRNLPPAVKDAVDLGRRIWSLLGRRDTSREKTGTLIAEIAALCGR